MATEAMRLPALHVWIFAVALGVAGCSAAQETHFRGLTGTLPIDRLTTLDGPWRGQTFVIRQVSGGPYPERPFEWSKTVWHSGYLHGAFYEGFHRLPIGDIDAFVASGVVAALRTAGMVQSAAGDRAAYQVDIEVIQIFLKTWLKKEGAYRACLTKLALSIVANDRPVSDIVEGFAKLDGANTRAVGRQGLRVAVDYYDEGPNVTAIAIADAVREFLEKNRSKLARVP